MNESREVALATVHLSLIKPPEQPQVASGDKSPQHVQSQNLSHCTEADRLRERGPPAAGAGNTTSPPFTPVTTAIHASK